MREEFARSLAVESEARALSEQRATDRQEQLSRVTAERDEATRQGRLAWAEVRRKDDEVEAMREDHAAQLSALDDGSAVVEVDTVDAEGSTAPAAPPVD